MITRKEIIVKTKQPGTDKLGVEFGIIINEHGYCHIYIKSQPGEYKSYTPRYDIDQNPEVIIMEGSPLLEENKKIREEMTNG